MLTNTSAAPAASDQRSTARADQTLGSAEDWMASSHAAGQMTMKGDRCEVTVTLLGSNLILFRMAGHLDADLGRRYLAVADRFPCRRESFHDWQEMTGYDTRVRLALTSWLLKNRGRMICHLLSRSRLVSMGVTVAQLAVGSAALRSYPDAADFYQAVDRAIHGRAPDTLRSPRLVSPRGARGSA